MEQKYIAGDCVRYIGIATPIVVKIDEVREGRLILEFTKGNRSWHLADYSEIEPVFITPAILKKNGWKEKDGDYVNENHHLALCEKCSGYGVYKIIDGQITWLMDLEYVHQLQHLLFGLGLNSDMKI